MSIAFVAISGSFQGSLTTSNGVDGKAASFVSLTAAAAAVRPWKAPLKNTTLRRRVKASACLSAFSFASAPLFVTNTLQPSSLGGKFASNADRKQWRDSWSIRFVANDRRFHCSLMTLPRPGSPAPSVLTQWPP